VADPLLPGKLGIAKLYVRGLPDITVGPWQMEEDTLDSDEEVEYMVVDGTDPCPSM